jgi:hypothetical protein
MAQTILFSKSEQQAWEGNLPYSNAPIIEKDLDVVLYVKFDFQE